MQDTTQLRQEIGQFISVVQSIEIENAAAIRSREQLEKTISELIQNNKDNREALDIATHAIEILRKVSDEAVSKAYAFLEQSLNTALAKMFENTDRKIEIKESTRAGQYPQLELLLHVGNDKIRSLKTDSGHGIAQIVSLLSILSLIVITGSRRILVIDEVLSGVSVRNREVVSNILWSFSEIGFQFIINDHGFVPENSHVYHLEMVGDVSGIKKDYIATQGVYLQGDGALYDYGPSHSNKSDTDESDDYANDNISDNISEDVTSPEKFDNAGSVLSI